MAGEEDHHDEQEEHGEENAEADADVITLWSLRWGDDLD